MKIVQINAVYRFGSTGRMTQQLHEYMTAKGIKSYVAAGNVRSNNSDMIKLGSRFEDKLHGLLSRITGRQGYFSLFSTYLLIRKLKKIKPDLIHLGVLHSNCINLPMLLNYIAEKNIPLAITLHDCWYFTGHCCYFTDHGDCQKWRYHCGKCPALRFWNPSWFFDFSQKNLQDKKKMFGEINRLAVIGVSQWITSFAKQSCLEDATNIVCIYNWIDTNKFHPLPEQAIQMRSKHNLENTFIVVCVSQVWSSGKGYDDIIKVADCCKDMRFVLVGRIPENLQHPSENVINIPPVSSQTELAAIYSAADVFVHLSTRETFGLVTAEAMACGTPVVAYNVTATPELVADGCGYTVEPHDIDSVVNALKAIKQKGKVSYSNRCIANVQEHFQQEKQLQAYVDLYTQLIRQ